MYFGGPQLAGFVEGNDVVVKVYKADEGVEYDTELTWSAGTGTFGDVIQQVSEISLVDGNACADDNDATAAFGGCAGAVAALGCDFVFAGSPISELCPETCGQCEEEPPVCEDDNDSVSGFGGCAGAVAALGCDFIFAGSLYQSIVLKHVVDVVVKILVKIRVLVTLEMKVIVYIQRKIMIVMVIAL